MVESYYNSATNYLSDTLGANYLLIIILFTTVISLIYFVVITYIITQMDKAYFIRKKNHALKPTNSLRDNPKLTLVNKSAIYAINFTKTIVGIVLLVLGALMLFLPGQGLITILIGLSLIPFPGKDKLELQLLSRRSVRTSLNWIRDKANKERFVFD